MITIKTIKDDSIESKHGSASMNIKKGTLHTTMLLGIEMLVEALLSESSANITIDYLLQEIKRIYERDNKKDEN